MLFFKTLASSPTESLILLGIKFYERGSSFKRYLQEMEIGESLMAGQLAGDFLLPKNTQKKLVFIAGGIGITPFRSMLKYLSDKNEQRDVALIYLNKGPEDVAYADILEEAQNKINLKLVYSFTATMPEGWTGQTGRVTPQMIEAELPDFAERLFYLSGPHEMVSGTEKVLKSMGISSKNIQKDFFPGLA